MAGGDTNLFRTPYPKGEDGYVPLIFSGISLTGVTGSQTLASLTLPFKCKCAYAEVVAGGAVTDADADSTIAVVDDTGTPKEFVTAQVLTALAAGAVKALTVNKNVVFFAGAILKVLWVPGDAGDALVNCTVVLWVKPVH